MYINYGNNLFLPERDDYSKSEFNNETEELEAEGKAVLNRLREQQVRNNNKNNCINKTCTKDKVDKNKKLTYKEIFDSVASTR